MIKMLPAIPVSREWEIVCEMRDLISRIVGCAATASDWERFRALQRERVERMKPKQP